AELPRDVASRHRRRAGELGEDGERSHERAPGVLAGGERADHALLGRIERVNVCDVRRHLAREERLHLAIEIGDGDRSSVGWVFRTRLSGCRVRKDPAYDGRRVQKDPPYGGQERDGFSPANEYHLIGSTLLPSYSTTMTVAIGSKIGRSRLITARPFSVFRSTGALSASRYARLTVFLIAGIWNGARGSSKNVTYNLPGFVVT